ncbi:hypothetical protein G4L39_07380 [Limisphaera ngatamarikiensis]|uniref:RHS repeat-associated core domain-containing protein n=1 Tax=Limisphaera ngatamarikiensis TaxID=1324935 RepID=A0A6M1RNT8_9BACT|nr:hypothetical protein [Limisphaera ngatamarikiensis]
MAVNNFIRFSTKRTEDGTGLVLYEYRAYSPALGRWWSRDPINEPGHRILTHKGHFRLKLSEEHNLYCALRNSVMNLNDADGRGIVLVIVCSIVGGAAVAIGVGIGYCTDVLGCWLRVLLALFDGEQEADRVAPDDTTHRGPNAAEGGDADALRHCIAACNLARNWYPCLGPDGALERLQARETSRSPGSQMDGLNNEVGIGIGYGLECGKSCTDACLDALRKGLLYEIRNGQIVPSPDE